MLLLTALLSQTVVVDVTEYPSAAPAADCTILIHGLARTARSMKPVAEVLRDEGHAVVMLNYPSRKFDIPSLATTTISTGLKACTKIAPDARRNFVTHSLGGILLRYHFEAQPDTSVNRVVMLGPPNRGSHVADKLHRVPGYGFLNGPAGRQLGTGADSVPNTLGKVPFTLGVIAGSRTVNPILSTMIPNPDDGKVHVDNTKVEGMTDFCVVKASHTFLMGNDVALGQIVNFLQEGRFEKDADDACAVAVRERT